MKKKKNNTKKRKQLAWVPVTVMLALTYYLSAIPQLQVIPVLRQVNHFLDQMNLGVAELARAIASRLPAELESVGTITGNFYDYARKNPVIVEFMLRKSAHLVVFFLITLLFFVFWRHYLKPSWAVFTAFACGTLAAVLDEIHQYYVSGRAGSIIDVYINMIGILLAVILIGIAFYLIKPIYADKE